MYLLYLAPILAERFLVGNEESGTRRSRGTAEQIDRFKRKIFFSTPSIIPSSLFFPLLPSRLAPPTEVPRNHQPTDLLASHSPLTSSKPICALSYPIPSHPMLSNPVLSPQNYRITKTWFLFNKPNTDPLDQTQALHATPLHSSKKPPPPLFSATRSTTCHVPRSTLHTHEKKGLPAARLTC